MMTVKLPVFITIMLLPLLVMAQSIERKEITDSLMSALYKSKEDTGKVNLLTTLCYQYKNTQPDSGLYYGAEAIELAEALHWKKGLAKALLCTGNNYQSLSDSLHALENYQKALTIYQQTNDTDGIAWSLQNTGNVYLFLLSDYPKSISYYLQSSRLFQQVHDMKGLAASYENIAINYENFGDYPKALQQFQQAERIDEQLHDEEALATNYSHMGIFYNDLSQNEKALDYCKKALVIFQRKGNKKGVAHNLTTIGSIYLDLHKNDNAIDYFKQSIEINKQIHNLAGIAGDIGNMGIAYTELKNYDEALKCHLQSYEMNKQLGDKSGMASAMANAGDVYFRKPPASSYNYKKAFENYAAALAIAKQIDALDLQEYSLQGMSNVYEKQQDYKQAFTTYKNYISIRDSILNDEKQKEITRKEIAYDYDKKETVLKAEQDKKNILAATEIKKQTLIKNNTLGGVAMAAVFSFFMIASYNRRRKTKFDKQVKEVEMKALRAQMNPHFIFNSLHSINKYVIENDREKASSYLSKFASLMRLILDNSREQEVPLEKDLHALELYMQLEALRFKNRFTYRIETDEDIDRENVLIPPMLLQPFVENAILHGIQGKENGVIEIRIRKKNEMICCIIEDNGKGNTSAIITKLGEGELHTSLGKKIISERLQIINSVKKTKASVNFLNLQDALNKPAGLRVELMLPLELAF